MGQHSSTPKEEDYRNLDFNFTEYFRKYKPEIKIISEETIHSIDLCIRKGDLNGARSIISDVLKIIDNAPINIAVTGESGGGKSSFINALIGIGPEDKGAAEVGVIETTMKRTPYKHPKIKTLTFWDLPGVGTQKFPPKAYLEEVKFEEYNFFIIVSATRFTKLELDLAQAIGIMKKNYYLVRTKVDVDLENEKRFKPHIFEREKTLSQIRSYSVNTFSDSKMAVPQIFLISNYDLSDYDFPVLMDTLIKDLPVLKRHNFMLSLPDITEAAIDRKNKAIQQFAYLEAFKTMFLATHPEAGIPRDNDVEKLKKSLNHYRQLFGIDDESLEFMAKDFQVPVGHLKEYIKSPNLLNTKRQEVLLEELLKSLEKFKSAYGWLTAIKLYIWKTFYLRQHFVNIVTEDAKVLLQWTNSKK
ncbi:interferon-inducible GTPase 1-like [Arvicanthis niloticus]|uniref:interferon-inducible GTPase 1-like n=1 Tax=Arvicanthis niloticus TaxID=61156 RepID=UPI0014873508|nr:interferon-inducible GTPase 1-like [Arvicanthis niloticus]